MELARGPVSLSKSIPERGAPSRRQQLELSKSRPSRTRLDPIVNALKNIRFQVSDLKSRAKREPD